LGLPAEAAQHIADLKKEALEEPAAVGEPRETAAAHKGAWRRCTTTAVRHFTSSVRECCRQQGGVLADHTYVQSICELAQQVVEHFVPCSGDSMDILDYVKIKKIPGGSIKDSQWVDGVIFSRDIAHRKMRSTVVSCSVALLREPLSFDADNRLTRLDDLRRQEADFIGVKVSKIADDLFPKPQLLLCQGGVSQIAQEKLRKMNISLVLGVPSHILDAVARCTGAKVVKTANSIVRPTAGCKNSVVGNCRHFTVVRTGPAGEAGSKPLAVVEGSCLNRFLTVCLRGGDSSETDKALEQLAYAKKVLQWATRLARHLQLESELLFEMWCEPWPRPGPTLVPDVADLQEGEKLDLVCYSVSKKEERNCTHPVMLRLPAYVLPQPGNQSAARTAPQSTGWAGGLDYCWLEGIRDCTFHEWLMLCFAPELPAGTTLCLSATPCTDDAKLPGEDMATEQASYSVARDNIGSTSGSNSATGVASRFLAPPVPSKGEVVCFQHGRSRVVIELLESDEPLRRGQGGKEWHLATRWKLLERCDDDGCQDADANAIHQNSAFNNTASNTGSSTGPPAANHDLETSFGAHGGIGHAGHSTTASHGEVEIWRWCNLCRRQVTPRNVLSLSAGWHSFTKLIEMLLDNSVSVCCPLVASGSGHRPCPHTAFRNHVLFCSSPHRTLVVGFKWEQVQLWNLHPPHLPFWDPHNRGFTASTEPSAVEQDGNLTAPSCIETCEQMRKLVRKSRDNIGRLVKIILPALRINEEFPQASSGFEAETHTWESNLQRQSHCHPPPWLSGWISESRKAWHRTLWQLNDLHRALGDGLDLAHERLHAKSAGDVDPVVVNFVARDLLELLSEDPCCPAAQGSVAASARSACSEINALRKLRHAPHEEERKAGLFPLAGAVSTLASSARDTLKRLWVTDAEAPEAAPKDGLSSAASTLRRCRTPQARPSRRRHIQRSLSTEDLVLHRPGFAWRRTTTVGSNLVGEAEEAPDFQRLPMEMKSAAEALERAITEATNCRLRALERGVQRLSLPVQEDDVGSVIAHALLSRQANEQLAAQFAQLSGGVGRCPLAEPQSTSKNCEEWSCFASLPECLRACKARAPCDVDADRREQVTPPLQCRCTSSEAPASKEPPKLASLPWKRVPRHEDDSGFPLARHSWEDDWERRGVRSILKAPTTREPVKVEFLDKESKYSVNIHHAPQYHIMRHWLCGDDLNFARSLHRCTRITPTGGKSNATFFVSHDRRFLLKAVNKYEFKMLINQVDSLFWHADCVLFDKLPSVLAQVVGLFSVSVVRRHKSKVFRKNFIVQRNLRYSLHCKPHYVFDLKGVGKNRRTPAVAQGLSEMPCVDESVEEEEEQQRQEEDEDPQLCPSGSACENGGTSLHTNRKQNNDGKQNNEAGRPVLWDQNFREWTEGKPLCLVPRDLKYLEAAVCNDTLLLSKLSLVDYSLLLAAVMPDKDEARGQNERRGTLCLGIIDYLRTYGFAEQVETTVKTLAHTYKPTVIEPVEYARRFLNAMRTFFVADTPP